PAGGGGVSVNYATADQSPGAGHAVGGATCDGTSDYQTTNGTVNFAAGERIKTVSVNVCADSTPSEPDETFLLNLSGAVGGNIVDAQAVGTITANNPAGTFIISELRTSGPGGLGDDFVELYNNTDTPLTVAASDASAGFGVCDLLREGNTLPPVSGSTTQYSFFRKECDFVSGVGCTTPGNPKDTNDNSADFKFADTQGTFISGIPQQLGAPGPENKTST